MRKRVLSTHVPDRRGERVTVQGWVHRLFHRQDELNLVIRDRCGLVQAVLRRGSPCPFELLQPETVVSVTGEVMSSPLAPGAVEIEVEGLEVLSRPLEKPPLDLGWPVPPHIPAALEHRVIALRHPTVQAVFRIQDELVALMRSFLHAHGFLEVRTPRVVNAAAGPGDGRTAFGLAFFERRACLAEGSSLYKQMLIGSGFERVFEVGPAFRQEESPSPRHLAEFTVLEAEMAFVDDEGDAMDLLERLLRYVLHGLRERRLREMELLESHVPAAVPMPRLPLAEAREILGRVFGRDTQGGDLSPADEFLLGQYVKESTGSEFVFITGYPAEGRPFHDRLSPRNPNAASTFDLLFRGEEICTGGLRVHDHDELVANLRRCGMNVDALAFYLEPFRYGMPPHAGFALGVERITARLLNLGHVRLASPFPRDREFLVP